MYLRIRDVIAETTAKCGFENPTGWLDSLSSNSESGKELKKAMEGYFLQKQSWPWIEVILELILLKHSYSNRLAKPFGIKKLES